MKPRVTLALMSACLWALTGMASAGEIKPYTQATFERLTQNNQPILVDVTASWCPTCKAQKPIIEKLMGQAAFKDVTTLTVDFDTEKTVLQQHKVGMQSTLIAFKGSQEVGRSVGSTSPASIERLLEKTLR